MPKFRVEISCTSTEIYEVEAETALDAELNVMIDGKLVDSTEEDHTITGVKEIK